MIWLLYILLDALFNYWWIEKKKQKPFYLVWFLVRGIFAIVYGGAVLDTQANFQDTFQWLCQVLLPFPFLFNTLLNSFRGNAIDYLGAESGWIDSFIVNRKLQRLYYWFTLILFIISIRML